MIKEIFQVIPMHAKVWKPVQKEIFIDLTYPYTPDFVRAANWSKDVFWLYS